MSTLPVAVHTAEQVRALDRHAIDDLRIASYTLMTRAGEAALGALRSCWPSVRRIAVVCGPGNNGGDGYVLARLARAQRLEIVAVGLHEPASLQGDARRAHDDFVAAGGTVVGWEANCLRGFRHRRRCDLRRRSVASGRGRRCASHRRDQRPWRAGASARHSQRAARRHGRDSRRRGACRSERSPSSGSSSASISARGRTASASSCSTTSNCRRRRCRTSSLPRHSSTKPQSPSCCRRVGAPRTKVSRAACS